MRVPPRRSPLPTPCALLFASASVLAACSREPSGAASGAASSASSAALTPAEVAAPAVDEEVKPVYPLLTGPPDPLAERYCDALYGIGARRRAACCGGNVGSSLARECTRNLSGAVQLKAVTLDPADIDRCIAAVERSLDGCDWVAPLAASSPAPSACDGVVKGVLGAGATCRSSMECAAGLRCHDVGPTAVGRCGAPREAGPCGGSVDALTTYVRDEGVDRAHPECTGVCNKRRCEAFVKVGGDCTSTLQCGPDAVCANGSPGSAEGGRGSVGKCSAGRPAAAQGDACRDGHCPVGLRCEAGTCQSPRGEGQPCRADDECRGSCVKAAGAEAGTCTKSCGPTYLPGRPIAAAPSKKPRK